jgi:hypothetical protein
MLNEVLTATCDLNLSPICIFFDDLIFMNNDFELSLAELLDEVSAFEG